MCKFSEPNGNVKGQGCSGELAQKMQRSGWGESQHRLERDQSVEGFEGQGQEFCLCLTQFLEQRLG